MNAIQATVKLPNPFPIPKQSINAIQATVQVPQPTSPVPVSIHAINSKSVAHASYVDYHNDKVCFFEILNPFAENPYQIDGLNHQNFRPVTDVFLSCNFIWVCKYPSLAIQDP